MTIKQVAFFGDSYCYDSIQNKHSNCYRTGEETYIDKLSVPCVHFGLPGHGPNTTITQLRVWLENNQGDYRPPSWGKDLGYNVEETMFVFCWSDISRDRVLADPGRTACDSDLEDWKNFKHVEIMRDCVPNNEVALMGSDAPMVDEIREHYPKYAEAIELWWLYLRNEKQYVRNWETIKLAFKYLIQEYNVQNYAEFICFEPLAKYEEFKFDFIFDDKAWRCLYQFAQSRPDYGVQGVDDLKYFNHFSPQGHNDMARYLNEVIRKKCE